MLFKSKLVSGFSLPLLFTALFTLNACTPAPRTELSIEQKTADLYWVFSMFEENYAPLAYKAELRKFEWESVKKDFLARAAETRSNEEFYLLMHELVAKFTDAHTSASITNASLPGRATVAYLGFNGVRTKNGLKITALLPSVAGEMNYPLKMSDTILEMDGKSLDAQVADELLRYRNLGQSEASLTYLYTKLFNRVSTSDPMPKSDLARLTVLRNEDGKTVTIHMPWIIKDLISFSKEQEGAEARIKLENRLAEFDIKRPETSVFLLSNFLIHNQALVGHAMLPEMLRNIDPSALGFRLKNTFAFIDNQPSWTSKEWQRNLLKISSTLVKNGALYPGHDLSALKDDVEFSGVADYKNSRVVPETAIFLPEAKIFPTYLTAVKSEAIKTQVAVIAIPTFSPGASDEDALADFKKTLKTLQAQGIKNIVLDQLDNSGGSAALAFAMAQALSPTPIELPRLRLKISNTWLDEYESNSLDLTLPDNERELARRLFSQLKTEHTEGKRLSSPLKASDLFILSQTGNLELEEPFRVIALVNEMCASSCDIFTGILQDNAIATVFGAQTMGAGGNVVQHGLAPNSHLILNQTESLIIRSNGAYIENIGITPDIAFDFSQDRAEKYSEALKTALKHVTQ